VSDSILTRWNITEAELTDLVDKNPSLRGMLLGYVAEHKFHELFMTDSRFGRVVKDDDHDRRKKGDRRAKFEEMEVIFEVKSLQTAKVKHLGSDKWSGAAQVDASDSRKVDFDDGTSLTTTCLLRGDFDILAVNCFAYGEKWRYAFALNAELPQNVHKKYTVEQRKRLLPTMIRVPWPLQPPFTEDLFGLLERLRAARRTLPTTLPYID
jgi:hypothetical protein